MRQNRHVNIIAIKATSNYGTLNMELLYFRCRNKIASEQNIYPSNGGVCGFDMGPLSKYTEKLERVQKKRMTYTYSPRSLPKLVLNN